jgi:hypothetical protein
VGSHAAGLEVGRGNHSPLRAWEPALLEVMGIGYPGDKNQSLRAQVHALLFPGIQHGLDQDRSTDLDIVAARKQPNNQISNILRI